MNSRRSIKKLLKECYSNRISLEKAYQSLKDLPYKNLGFARMDHHRLLRKGFGEVVYCQGKTNKQVKTIVADMSKGNGHILLITTGQCHRLIRTYVAGGTYGYGHACGGKPI